MKKFYTITMMLFFVSSGAFGAASSSSNSSSSNQRPANINKKKRNKAKNTAQTTNPSASASGSTNIKQEPANINRKKRSKAKKAAKATSPSATAGTVSASPASPSSAFGNKQIPPMSGAKKKALARAIKTTNAPNSSSSSAACSSSSAASSSSRASNPTPIFTPKKILIVDEAEINALADTYKDPIPVDGIPGISNVFLTKQTLKHIFGMEVGDNKDGSFNLTGFHHDQQGQLDDQENIYYSSSHGYGAYRDEFIAYTRQQFPVYKTFFSSMQPRETIISMMIEALHNIQKVEDQGHALKIEGLAKNNMSIIIIIKKKNNNIITFFPKSPKTAKEIKNETNDLKKLFTKFFFNPSNKPLRQPITEEESEQLLALNPSGITVNWVLAKVDINTKDFYDYFFATHHMRFQPFFEDALLNQSLINELLDCDPGKIINIEHTIEKIAITPETLQNAFSEQNDPTFPAYLTRTEILEKLKEAIENYLPQKLDDSDKDESISQDETSGSDNDSGEHKENDFDQSDLEDLELKSNYPISYGTLESNGLSINCTTRLPEYAKRGELIAITSTSNGTTYADTWTFFILIDPLTGNISNFYPLFD